MNSGRIAALALALALGCDDGGASGPSGARDGGPQGDAAVAGCALGEQRPCDGPSGCAGVQTCGGDGAYGDCAGPVERCNGADDDCDGAIDEDWPQLGVTCRDGDGLCAVEGRVVCAPDGVDARCDAVAGDESPEQCDGVDNDCDGVIDEAVGVGEPCAADGVGVCADGRATCDDGRLGCAAPAPAAEQCNRLDDDCDGAVDEGDGGPLVEACYDGPDGTDGVGRCRAGARACGGGGECEGAVLPAAAEICGNGEDDDCDGRADCRDPACRPLPECTPPAGDGALYFIGGDGAFFGTTRLYVQDGEGEPRDVGVIRVGGQERPVESIAAVPGGALYGFVPGDDFTYVVTLDPETAEGRFVIGPDGEALSIEDYVFGAGAAPDGTIYVMLFNDLVVAPFDGMTFGEPVAELPDRIDFGDIAFDADGACYLVGVTFEGDPIGLHRCDLDAGTMEPLDDVAIGFDVEPVSPTGLTFGPGPDPCVGTLYGFEVRGVDEVGVYDLAADPPVFERRVGLSEDFGQPDFADAAGWYTPDAACDGLR